MRLMITTMRDEAPFLLEWIAYHRAIGFTDFLIFSNDCVDGTDAMLDRLAELGIITHLPNPREGQKAIQWQALTRARAHPLAQRAEWIMVADVDEFLVIHPGAGRLDDLFAAVPTADGFAVPWRMFGSGGRLRFEPGLVMEQFTRCGPETLLWPLRASQYKSLFRNDPRHARLGVHRPRPAGGGPPAGVWVDGNGQPFRPSSSFVMSERDKYGLAQINHYALGSAENFLVKTMRATPNREDESIDLGYWIERNFDTVEDRRILRHLGAVQQGVAAFLADAGLARLHEQGLAWRRRRIAEALLDDQRSLLFTRLAQSPSTPALPMELQRQLFRLRGRAQAALRDRDGGPRRPGSAP